MIEQGFPTLADFLERQQPDGPELLSKLKALHPKATELLYELLEPPPPPAPSCLTHMDFWCNNLLFRRTTPPEGTASSHENGNVLNGNGEASGSGNASSAEDGEYNTTECLIVDWQMMAISRPTHDVALLLFTSLSPEIRRGNTDALLRHYWNVFRVCNYIKHYLIAICYECYKKVSINYYCILFAEYCFQSQSRDSIRFWCDRE